MNEVDVVELALAIVAVIIGGTALTVGSIALAIVIGIKNSTHQVVWKSLEEPKKGEDDPFEEDMDEQFADLDVNPNKKLKKQKTEETEEQVELEDMTADSNNWN